MKKILFVFVLLLLIPSFYKLSAQYVSTYSYTTSNLMCPSQALLNGPYCNVVGSSGGNTCGYNPNDSTGYSETYYDLHNCGTPTPMGSGYPAGWCSRTCNAQLQIQGGRTLTGASCSGQGDVVCFFNTYSCNYLQPESQGSTILAQYPVDCTYGTIVPADVFKLTLSPSLVSINQGGNAIYTATLYSTYTGTATFAMACPTGATCTFSPTTRSYVSGTSDDSQSVTLTISNTAGVAPATYNIPVTATMGGNTSSDSKQLVVNPVVAPTLNAQCISISVPSTLYAGKTYPVIVTMKNTGTETWKPFNGSTNLHHIRVANNTDIPVAYNPSLYGNFWEDNSFGNTTSDIAQNGTFTFSFNASIPSSAPTGAKKLGVRMVKETVSYFGDVCTADVNIVPPANPTLDIDMPAKDSSQNGSVRFAGWAFDNMSIANPTPLISSVQLLEGSTILGTSGSNGAIYGGNRPDICSMTNRPSCPTTLNAGWDGFYWDVNNPAVPNGLHTLTVKATDAGGRSSAVNRTIYAVCRPVTWNASQSGFSTSPSGTITNTITVVAGSTFYIFGNYGEVNTFTWVNDFSACPSPEWYGWGGSDGKSAIYSCVAPSTPGSYTSAWRTATKADGNTNNICAQTNNSGTLTVQSPMPTCTGVAPESPTTSATSGSFYVYAYGVTNATAVKFYVWSEVNGQDDLWTGNNGVYSGTNIGSGTWRAAVNLANHRLNNPDYGFFNVHAYMENASYPPLGGGLGQICGMTGFTRNTLPNLTAGSVTPITATAGSALPFTATITNNGGTATGATFLNLFQVATAINGGGTVTSISALSTAALGSGGTVVVNSSNYTFPSAGSYSVRACADNNTSMVGTITESNEGDNCGAWTTVTVDSQPVNTATIQGFSRGQTISVAGGPSSSADPYFLTVNSGNTYTVTATLPGPGYTAYSSLCMDAIGNCHDDPSSNLNGTTRSVTFPLGAGHYADLWWFFTAPANLTAGSVTPITATAGSALPFTATITNNGGSGTGTAFNNFFQVATAINGGGTVSALSVNSIAALNAGASAPVTSSSYTFPSAGSYSVRVCADNNASWVGTITESNEGDNCGGWTTVTVNPASANPVTTNVTISPSPVTANGSTNHTITVVSTDGNGGTDITSQFAIINFQGVNAGLTRGYIGWSTQSFQGDTNRGTILACTGGGSAAKIGWSDYGDAYINLNSCSTSVSGITRTTNFVVSFNPVFTTPTTNNTISGRAIDSGGSTDGWNSFATFDLVAAPTATVIITSPSTFPVTVPTTITLNWTVSNAVGNCNTNNASPTWTGTRAPANGTQSEAIISTGAVPYTLTCTNSAGLPTSGTLNVVGAESNKTLTIIPSIGGKVTSADGIINCDVTGTCSKSYLNGTPVTLTATRASVNWKLTGWKTTPPNRCPGVGVCLVNMTTDTSVQALFVPVPVNYKEF